MEHSQTGPSEQTFIEQLSQLNQRVRLYAQQIWQVPFAYLGLVLLSFAGWDSFGPRMRGSIMIGMGVVGALVFCHHLGLVQANNRGVEKIEETERRLRLDVTVRRSGLIVCPLGALVLLVGLTELIGGATRLRWAAWAIVGIIAAFVIVLACCVYVHWSPPSSPTS